MRTALLGFLFLLPFQFALSPVPGIDLAVIRVISLLLAGTWLVRGLVRRRLLLPLDPAMFFVSGFLFLSVVSLFWSENGSFAVRKSLFLISFLPLFPVFVSWLREFPEDAVPFIRAFVWGAFFSALCAICIFFLQFFIGVDASLTLLTREVLPFFLGPAFAQAVAEYPSLLVNISGTTVLRASGVFPDPHMLSFYLGMAVPLAGYLFFRASSKKALWGIIFLVILVTDLLTFSRGGYVGLLFGSFVFFLTLTTLPLLRRQVFIVLLITMASLALLSPTPFGQRLFSSFSSIDTSNMERLRLWGEAVAHISERPLLGVGLGNYPLLLKPSATYREPIYAHNLYLDISLELGLIGLTFFLGIIGSAFIAARRFWHKNGDFLALTLMISLSIFSAHSLFDTALYSVHVLPTLIFLLALATTLRHRNVTLTV